jgi:hypothetical protein
MGPPSHRPAEAGIQDPCRESVQCWQHPSTHATAGARQVTQPPIGIGQRELPGRDAFDQAVATDATVLAQAWFDAAVYLAATVRSAERDEWSPEVGATVQQ